MRGLDSKTKSKCAAVVLSEIPLKRSDQIRYLAGDKCRDNNIMFFVLATIAREKHQDLEFGNKRLCACPNVPISSRTDRRFSVSYHHGKWGSADKARTGNMRS